MDGKLIASGMELLAKLTRRSSARLLSVGDDDHDARLGAEIERLSRLLDALGQRRLSGRNDRIHRVHDGTSGIGRRLELEFDVALVPRSRTVGHEADATKFGGVRQHLSKRGSSFVDPGSGVRMPRVSLPDIDPDASNTTIASSRQGGIVSLSARDVTLHARSTPMLWV